MIIAVTELNIFKSLVVTSTHKLQNLFLDGISLIVLFIFLGLVSSFEQGSIF